MQVDRKVLIKTRSCIFPRVEVELKNVYPGSSRKLQNALLLLSQTFLINSLALSLPPGCPRLLLLPPLGSLRLDEVHSRQRRRVQRPERNQAFGEGGLEPTSVIFNRAGTSISKERLL